jgi:hypothetical protein
MRWFRRRQHVDMPRAEPVDLDEVLKEGRHDARTARDAIDQIEQVLRRIG